MEVSEARYAGFWKRSWAAVTDALFFQLVVFVIMLAVGRSDYLGYLEARFATISKLAEGPIDVSALRQVARGSYSPLEGAMHFWLPVVATIFFWFARSATPGLMAIPARIVDVRTAKKPSAPRLLLRFVASWLLGYTFGLDCLWIAFSKRRQAVHDVVARTAVVIAPACVNSGEWSRPNRKIVGAYLVTAIVAALSNFGMDRLLFDPSAAKTAVLPNLIISSYFHEMPRPLWLECVSLLLVMAVFLMPSLCFRFSLRWLDRWWLIASALSFSGSLSNILERAFTGGVRDIFYVEGGLRYMCLYCGLKFHSYFGNLADLFESVGAYSMLFILLVSRSWLIWKWFRSGAAW